MQELRKGEYISVYITRAMRRDIHLPILAYGSDLHMKEGTAIISECFAAHGDEMETWEQ